MKKLGILGFLLFFVTAVFAIKQPLQPDQAFGFSAKQEGNAVLVQWDLKPGYYLYKNDFKFEFEPKEVQPGWIEFPESTKKEDKMNGTEEVYFKHLDLKIPYSSTVSGRGKLKISYQGCSEEGFCYPPMSKEVVITLQPGKASAPQKAQPEAKSDDSVSSMFNSPEKIKDFFQTESSIILLLGFFGFGLLLSFTPCVLPMIPILSGIILGQGKVSPLRAFSFSAMYVLGMGFAYSLAGLLASLAGSHLQSYMQSPIILSIFSVMFVILALSLFGLFDLKMPQFLHHHATRLSNKQKSGSFVGTFIMGFLSILIVSPCVSAPLVAALGIISQKGSLVLGTLALFFMGIGMGVPLLILGTFGPQLLPKTGKWMHAVKAAFGVMMLGLAIMLLSRFLPGFIVLVLWAGLFIITAVNMGIFTSLPAHSGARVWQGLGYIFFVYGIILLVGAAQGNSSPLMPLTKDKPAQEHRCMLNFQTVRTLGELNTALAGAKGQYVMVDFFADWCVSCHELEQFTFSNADVQEKLKSMVLIKADVTSANEVTQALEAKYHVIAPPTLLFFNTEGKWLQDKTVVGGVNAETLLSHLDSLG